jgi:hypothetical protein
LIGSTTATIHGPYASRTAVEASAGNLRSIAPLLCQDAGDDLHCPSFDISFGLDVPAQMRGREIRPGRYEAEIPFVHADELTALQKQAEFKFCWQHATSLWPAIESADVASIARAATIIAAEERRHSQRADHDISRNCRVQSLFDWAATVAR